MTDVHLDGFGWGPDVVLLHGTPVFPSHLYALAREVAVSHRAWVAHLPGYGRTPALPAGHSAADIQQAVERALLERGVRAAFFVGQSGGGYHALGIALGGRVRAHALVALGGLAGLAPDHRAGFLELARALRGGLDLAPKLPELLLSPAFAEAHPAAVAEVRGWASAKPPHLVADELEAFARSDDLAPRLGELDVPVVARVGELDVATPLAYSEAIAHGAPRGSLQVVPGAAHALLLEDFAATAEAVLAALCTARA